MHRSIKRTNQTSFTVIEDGFLKQVAECCKHTLGIEWRSIRNESRQYQPLSIKSKAQGGAVVFSD